MSTGLHVKTAVIGGIAVVALISLGISGVGQYLERTAAGRQQIREINEAIVQPVSELAGRGVSGGNIMVLSDAAANGLYKASGVRYLKIEGMSDGADKTAFTEAIPPQMIVHEFAMAGADISVLKAAAKSMAVSGFVEKDYLYVIKDALPSVKNGGQITAVFSAEQLATLPTRTVKSLLPMALSVMILAVALAWFVGARIAKPISRLAIRVGEIGGSLDLSQRVKLTAADVAFNREAGETAETFNQLLGSLQATLREVLVNVAQVNQAVERVSQLAGTVAASSEEQQDSSTQMAAAIEQSSANLSEIAQNARSLDNAARQSGELSAAGSVIILRAGSEMGEIARTVREGTSSIEALGQQSNAISAIVQVIKEIADQTNLLALNAAIEAARAGEQGRGFAVVADEVRKLAERTAQSTAQIADMITGIQGSSARAVSVMDDTAQRVNSGVDLAGQAGQSITRISDSNSHVMRDVEAIADALEQQSQAHQQIQRHVESIARMTRGNTDAASAAAHAARALEDLSRSMRDAVSRFRT